MRKKKISVQKASYKFIVMLNLHKLGVNMDRALSFVPAGAHILYETAKEVPLEKNSFARDTRIV